MKKYMILILLLLIPLSAKGQFKGRWRSGANAPTAEHTTVKVDTLEELTSSHGVVVKSDLKTLANVVFEMGASEEISLTDATDTYYVLVSSDALTFQNDAGTPVTLATLDSTGLTTIKGNNANAAKILLSLVNTDEQASGELNQTSDIYFYVQGTSNNGTSYANAATARIKAGKSGDYFNASGTADNDGLFAIQVPSAGTLTDRFSANYFYSALAVGTDYIYWDGTALYCTDDTYDLGKIANRYNDIYSSDNIYHGGKGQTAKIYISQEATIAGTDSSVVGWVDDGNGKLELKAGDADSLVLSCDNDNAKLISNNSFLLNNKLLGWASKIYIDSTGIYGMDATDADTFSISDDGTNTNISSDNPIQFDNEPKYTDGTYTHRIQRAMEGWVTHDAATDTITIGILPANAIVTNINIWTFEAFDADGTDEVCVGYSGTAEAYAVDVDVSDTGVETWTAGTTAKTVDATSRTVQVYYHTSDATNLANGECHVIVEWYQATVNP